MGLVGPRRWARLGLFQESPGRLGIATKKACPVRSYPASITLYAVARAFAKKAGPRGPAFLRMVAGTGFEPVTFRL